MQQKIIETLRKTLPPLFTRAEASRFLGGLYSVGTLANLDWKKKGPGGTRLGQKVLHERDSFILWLEERLLNSESRPVGKRRARDE